MKEIIVLVDGKAYGDWLIPDSRVKDIEELLDEFSQEDEK